MLNGRRVFALAAGLLALAGLLLRARLAPANVFPSVDGVMYLDQAFQLLNHGRLPYSCFPPGWPLIVSLPLLLLDRGEPLALLRAAQAANVVMGALLPLLTLALLRRHLGRLPALLGMAILVLLPQTLILSKGDLSDLSYACGLLGSWLLLERRRDLAAGLLLGFTYLIRPEALFAALAVGAWRWRHDGRLPWRFGLGLPVFMVPYLVFVRVAGGVWGLSSKDEALTLTLKSHPGWHYPGLVLANLGEFLPLVIGLLGVPLILLAAWGAVRRPGPWLLLLAPLLPVPLVINPMVVRFWVPYLPVVLLAAGLGAADLAARTGGLLRGRGRPLGAAVLAVAAFGGFWLASRDEIPWVERNTEAFYGLKDAGHWLRDQVDERTVIAAYKPYTSFWAGCRFIKIPDEPAAEAIVAWARNHGADYLVVNVQVVHQLAPGLDALLENPLRPSLAGQVTLVKLFEYDLTGHNTAVYRIVRSPAP